MEIPVETATLVMLGSMIFLMMLGLPLAFITISIALVGAVVFIGPNALPLVSSRMYTLIVEYTLVAVPLFILMSTFMEKSGIARDLFDAMSVCRNSIPGGVGVQTMVAAVFLAAITGIAGGELLMLGLVALPQLLRLGYNKHLSVGLICVGGGLGTMIPPSIILIFFAFGIVVYSRSKFLNYFINMFFFTNKHWSNNQTISCCFKINSSFITMFKTCKSSCSRFFIHFNIYSTHHSISSYIIYNLYIINCITLRIHYFLFKIYLGT